MPETDSYKRRLWIYILDALLVAAILYWLLKSFAHLSSYDSSSTTAKPSAPVTTSTPVKQSPLLGIDVSHYQGDVEWTVVAEDFHFAFIKATEGDEYVDPQFKDNLENVQSTNLNFGAYHFFSPEKDALEQARHFLKTTNSFNFSLPPVLDVEVAPDGNVDEFQQAVKQWLVHVKQTTGCTPIIYSGKYFWEQYLKSEFSDYPIWISDYTTESRRVADIPWEFWQYTEKGQVDGVSGLVDQSRFQGTEAKLKSLGSCQVSTWPVGSHYFGEMIFSATKAQRRERSRSYVTRVGTQEAVKSSRPKYA